MMIPLEVILDRDPYLPWVSAPISEVISGKAASSQALVASAARSRHLAPICIHLRMADIAIAERRLLRAISAAGHTSASADCRISDLPTEHADRSGERMGRDDS